MSRLELYIPNLDDYWYKEKIQSDPATMSYNAGWNVSYYGYHYDTGCIDFSKEKWREKHNKRQNDKIFLAYLKDIELNEFIGYVNYNFNEIDNKYECGILIEFKYRGKGYSKEGLKLLCDYAQKHGIKELYDYFESNRNGIEVFEDVGFKVVDKYSLIRFNNIIEMVVVKKEL